MNCQDFETIWSNLFDAPHRHPNEVTTGLHSAGSSELDWHESLREHAQTCPGCRTRMNQYETLRLAIRSWELTPKPAPSNDLVDRILAAAAASPAPISRQHSRLWRITWVAAASAVAASIAVAIIRRGDQPAPENSKPAVAIARGDRRAEEPTPATPPRPDTRALRQALSEAGEATWELAYAASGPALRIGRQVLEPADVPVSLEGFDSPESSNPGQIISEVLNDFGEELTSGVRPLSDSARRALDFLRAVVPGTDRGLKNPPPTSPKGA